MFVLMGYNIKALVGAANLPKNRESSVEQERGDGSRRGGEFLESVGCGFFDFFQFHQAVKCCRVRIDAADKRF